jgi:hypothetical protein
MNATLASMLLVAMQAPTHHHAYSFDGVFLEGCSCKDVCVTEITGKDAGCHGMGAIDFKKGKFDGADFSGTRVAFAWDSAKWVRIYVDAPDEKRKALTDFMTTMLADWGSLEGVTPAKITVSKASGHLGFSVNDGTVLSMDLKPVLGADGINGVEHTNLASPFHRSLTQAVTTNAALSDAHPFVLQDTNAFYNLHCVMKGRK